MSKPRMSFAEMVLLPGAGKKQGGDEMVFDFTPDYTDIESAIECCDCGLVHRIEVSLRGQRVGIRFWREDEKHAITNALADAQTGGGEDG